MRRVLCIEYSSSNFYTILEFSGSGDIIGIGGWESIYLIGGYELISVWRIREDTITKIDLWIRR